MEISPTQLINPGALKYDEDRRKTLVRFKEAVQHAKFINNNDKRNWTILAYLLTSEQLQEAQKLIIDEDLRKLKLNKKLEILPSKEK